MPLLRNYLIHKTESPSQYNNLCTFSDTWTEEPNRGLRPSKKSSEMKYESRSLRLSNNIIDDLHDLQMTVSHFLAEPSRLAWLDLSFNRISHINQVDIIPPWLAKCFVVLQSQHGCNLFMCSCSRFCASCKNCVCCICTATAFLSCQRWTGSGCFHTYTLLHCMGMQ